jgi:hypothetical protein
MTYPEMIIILVGAAIALCPIGIMLGANLLQQWQDENKEEDECK